MATAMRPHERDLTTGDISKICKVSPIVVTRWIKSGRLEGYEIPSSKHRRVPRATLIRFLEEYGLPMTGVAEAAHRQILVVGADPSVSEHLANRFREADDFHVSTAPSPLEAGYRIATAYPACLVIDLAIGRIDAAQIIEGVREIPVKVPTKIVLLASDEPGEILDRMRPHEVLRKPFAAESLATLIRKLIA